MSKLLQIVENEETSELYPTPRSLIERMLSGIDWDYIRTILEPSAGKGDILREIARQTKSRYCNSSMDIDCVEIDPNLRQILKYNFSDERKSVINRKISGIESFKRVWNDETRKYENKLTEQQKIELRELEEEKSTFFESGIHIVHDDFLTYNPYKHYDLIIMNPPFSNGDKHLLKALKMQERGGNIICLLNAETLRNPYTETRKELLKQLDKHNAIIEYINGAFTTAERRTGVEVALIKVAIPQVQEESDIYSRLKEASGVEDFNPEATDLEVTDIIKAAVNQYNLEVKAGLELIRQYRTMKPYMLRSFDTEEKKNADGTITRDYVSKATVLNLYVDGDRTWSAEDHINEYVEAVRLKYWRALISNKSFIGKLTWKLQDEYRTKINTFKKYEFSEFNIKALHAEINMQIKKGIEDEIIVMFDRLTAEHSWYPECQKNKHYYDGWKTNKAHKIDKKVIIPCYGIFDSWDGKPRQYEAQKALEDIERILNFLDGNMTEEVNSWSFLTHYFNCGITKKIPMKFFKATFYKKGTVHLEFTCPELIERFNIYVAQNKQWLPPTYGKKTYKDMNEEEKAAVDSFQGEKAYNEVMAKAGYYLAPVTNNQMLMLGE